MTRRGDIRNDDYAHKARTYVWSTVSSLFPRNISPTDVDASFELNGHFLFVEAKTMGTPLPNGQRLYLDRLLELLRVRACILVVEHSQLKTVDIAADIKLMSVWWWDDAVHGICKLTKSECTPDALMWWFDQWARKAQGTLNDFVRAMRESIGIHPPSQRRPFPYTGGEIWRPPFCIKESECRVERITRAKNKNFDSPPPTC